MVFIYSNRVFNSRPMYKNILTKKPGTTPEIMD